MQNKIPQRTQASINGLRQMIAYISKKYNTKELVITEIGSWVGTSAALFAKYFKKVFCIDPFVPVSDTISALYDMKKVKKLFLKNVSGYNNIEHIEDYSQNILDAKYNQFQTDVIYIDGDHHYDAVAADIQTAIVITNKVIAGHDFWPGKFPGVVKAVKEVFQKPEKVFPDTSWIVDVEQAWVKKTNYLQGNCKKYVNGEVNQ